MMHITKIGCIFTALLAAITITGCCKKEPTLKDASKAYLSGNYEEASKIFIPKAEEGDAEALCNLGFMHYCGLHLKQNYEKAAQYYTKSAELNNVTAQFSLGTMYENGEGVSKNFGRAYFWYKIAENNGDKDAEYRRKIVEKRLNKRALKDLNKKISAWEPRKSLTDD